MFLHCLRAGEYEKAIVSINRILAAQPLNRYVKSLKAVACYLANKPERKHDSMKEAYLRLSPQKKTELRRLLRRWLPPTLKDRIPELLQRIETARGPHIIVFDACTEIKKVIARTAGASSGQVGSMVPTNHKTGA